MHIRVRWLLPPAGLLAVAAPAGLARAPDGGPAVQPAVVCAAAGFGDGGVTYPRAPAPGVTTFTDAHTTFTISRGHGDDLAWSSTAPVAAVLVRGRGATQRWPVTGATTGTGVHGPSDGTAVVAIDDVTFCFAPPPPPPAPPRLPLGLDVVAQGTFTRLPPAAAVRGELRIANPNEGSVPVDGLELVLSTRGTCSFVRPLEVPGGSTPIAFTCTVDVADAARHGTVDVRASSRSAGSAATTTVRWVEAG